MVLFLEDSLSQGNSENCEMKDYDFVFMFRIHFKENLVTCCVVTFFQPRLVLTFNPGWP